MANFDNNAYKVDIVNITNIADITHIDNIAKISFLMNKNCSIKMCRETLQFCQIWLHHDF